MRNLPNLADLESFDIHLSIKRSTLEIQFPQPLDYFLVTGMHHDSRNSNGDVVAGKIEIADEERIFRFVPDEPWTKGTFALHD